MEHATGREERIAGDARVLDFVPDWVDANGCTIGIGYSPRRNRWVAFRARFRRGDGILELAPIQSDRLTPTAERNRIKPRLDRYAEQRKWTRA